MVLDKHFLKKQTATKPIRSYTADPPRPGQTCSYELGKLMTAKEADPEWLDSHRRRVRETGADTEST